MKIDVFSILIFLFFPVIGLGQTTGNAYRQLQNMASNPQVQLPKTNIQTDNGETLKMPPSNLEYVWAIEYSDRFIRSIRETWHQDHPKIKGYLTTQQECSAIIYKMDAGMQSNVRCIQVKNPYYSGSVKETENQPVQSENFEKAGIRVEKYDPVEYATKTQNNKEEKPKNDDPNTADLSFLKDTYSVEVDAGSLKDPMNNYTSKKVIVPPREKNTMQETSFYNKLKPYLLSPYAYLDAGHDLAIGLAGILIPAKVPIVPRYISYLAIADINLITEDIRAILDCTSNGKYECPSSSKIFKNAGIKTAKDFIDMGMGNLGAWSSGQVFKEIATSGTKKQMVKMVKKGVLPGIEGVVEKNSANIAQIGEAHSSIASGVFDAGKRILNAFGVQTIFDEPE